AARQGMRDGCEADRKRGKPGKTFVAQRRGALRRFTRVTDRAAVADVDQRNGGQTGLRQHHVRRLSHCSRPSGLALPSESKTRILADIMSTRRAPGSVVMDKGKLIISIDLESVWGVWDVLTPEHLRMAESAERPICAALVELFDRYQVPATWAVVAALLDEPSAAGRPGSKECWYAPDIIAGIVNAKVAHEIGSHSGRHIYFDRTTPAQAREDLEFARDIHRANGLPFRSFVYPRNAVAHVEALAEVGLRTFRGNDVDWTARVRHIGGLLGRAENLTDSRLPFPPAGVSPRGSGTRGVVPAWMLLRGRKGLRRFARPAVPRRKLQMGLERAKRRAEAFHLW